MMLQNVVITSSLFTSLPHVERKLFTVSRKTGSDTFAWPKQAYKEYRDGAMGVKRDDMRFGDGSVFVRRTCMVLIAAEGDMSPVPRECIELGSTRFDACTYRAG